MTGILTVTGPNKRKLEWDTDKPETVDEAVAAFNEAVHSWNMRAFSEVTKEPLSGEFDPKSATRTPERPVAPEEQVILISPMAGGC